MARSGFYSALVWLLASSCSALAVDVTRHEILHQVPTGWRRLRAADNASPITLNIALPYSDSAFERAAEQISDPDHARYGQYLSNTELSHLVTSSSDSSDAVKAWLDGHAIEHQHQPDSHTITFTTTVGTASKLLSTAFDQFERVQHDSSNARPIVRTTQYSVPAALRDHIDFIHPTIHFFSARKAAKAAKPDQQSLQPRLPPAIVNCTNAECPKALAKRYNIDYYPATAAANQTFAVTAFIENFPNLTEWKGFLHNYSTHPKQPVPPYKVISVNNGTTKIPPPAHANLQAEPLLDLDYSTAFTGPIPLELISTGGNGVELIQPGSRVSNKSANEPYLEFMQYILARKAPPQVISISYSDDEQSVPEKYARRVCALFAQAATRGISIIDASGDGGASGTQQPGPNCRGPTNKHTLIPSYPATCPWVVAVGATSASHSAASYSGGGFSRYFGRPAWQKDQVQHYLGELTGALSTANNTKSNLYNATGRGIPDVSLLGDNYYVPSAGPLKGTSASTPVFAAMVILLNDLRLKAGKPVLGFVNPLLYKASRVGVYRDIADNSTTIGCADVKRNFFLEGWPALAGWDAATGLGEPDFAKLRKSLEL